MYEAVINVKLSVIFSKNHYIVSPTKFTLHCVKHRNFNYLPSVEILWKGKGFRIVSGESPETMRKLCLSRKFPPQEISWNYDILGSAI